MELASAYKYCEIHSIRIGSLMAAKNYAALKNLTSWYACGRDVLQEAHGNDTKDASSSQVEQGFILWDKQLKKESLSPMRLKRESKKE
ncbi:hypothetical protein BM221_007784 [Beauveria bassiana]|uniref:Uncharacterized protein n=1 Tax=Beauveria bassiana TaxID=176275 RepID=A0A2N6NHM8_BEABA|nr:hypothetical protein BM221_007784 [Beauveria bassiana]